MSATNTNSPIENKKDEIDNTEGKQNDWKGFLKSIVKNFITLLIWSIIWALLICVSCSNLDAWLPDNPKEKPYSSGSASSESKGTFGGIFSNIKKGIGLKGGNKKMSGGNGVGNGGGNVVGEGSCKGIFKGRETPPEQLFKFGFPYTMINKDIENAIKNKATLPGDVSFMDQIKNIFGDSARYSYMKSRGLLKYIFETVGGRDLEKERGGNKPEFSDTALNYILFLIGPLLVTFSFIYPVALLIGTILTFVGSIFGMFGLLQTKSIVGKILWGMFFLMFGFVIYGTWAICIGSAMYFQYIGTYLTQLYSNFAQISEFLLCNSRFIGIIFGIMLTASANANLDIYWTFGILIGFFIWFLNSKKTVNK